MSNDLLLTDEYVAGILAEEAKDCSLKFSAMGMDSSRAGKKNYRPNTTFLERIIKGTDTHNKAKLASQAAESQARLKELEFAEKVKRQKTNPNASDIRKRQMGAIHAILGDKNRSRDEGDGLEAAKPERKTRDKQDKSEKSVKRSRVERSSNREEDLFRDRHDESKRHRLSESGHKRDNASKKDEGRGSRRNREDEVALRERESTRHSRSRRDRSKSPRRHRRSRSRSPGERKSKHRHRSRDRSISRREPRTTRRATDGKQDDDSDNDLIGPAPPPKHRGRGIIGGASSLDRRFSESYDPKTDGHAGSDEETWDDAVEAYRDRQKLRQNQEQRMKAAGFAEEQIRKVSTAVDDPEQLVVWSKAGEERAWDKGKGLEDEEMGETPDLLLGNF